MRKMRGAILGLLALALPVLSVLPAGAANKAKPRLIVTFKKGLTKEERQAAARAAGANVIAILDSIDVAIVDAPGGLAHPSAALLRTSPSVVEVEEDYYAKWLYQEPAAGLPTMAGFLQGLREAPAPQAPGETAPPPKPVAEIPWGVARVDAPSAWIKGQGSTQGAGVRVAVIDTGVDCSHPDLQCDEGAGTNFVTPGTAPMDDNGHGTHVSGTIAARWDGKGVVGVAPMAAIIPVKVLDADGSGTLSDVIKGIAWAAEHHVDVINMSLGGPTGSAAMKSAVEHAVAAGVTIVAAAGNEGPDEGSVGYPAAYPQVIAVAASDSSDNVADFSSRGPQVALIAPGVDVYSLAPGGGYATHSGTSMASPHVAGLAALAIAAGAKGPAAVRSALLSAATPLCSESKGCLAPTAQGKGLVDAVKLER